MYRFNIRVSRICDLDQEAAQVLQEQFIPHLVHRGIAISCFVLARCLQLGQGIERSEEKAKMYFDKVTWKKLLDDRCQIINMCRHLCLIKRSHQSYTQR